MVVGGYKRVAVAALARTRLKGQEQTRCTQHQDSNRSNHAPGTDHEHSESATPHTRERSSFADLPGKIQETLKQQEKWNAKKQQLEKAEKKRKRNQEKKQRRNARKKQLKESVQTDSMHQGSNHRTQEDLLAPEAEKTPNLNSQAAQSLTSEPEHRELEQYGTELLEDVFMEPSKETLHQLGGRTHKLGPEKANKSPQLHLKVRSPGQTGTQSRTSTSPPSVNGHITPLPPATTPDVLIITPRRRAAAQIECAISPTSSKPLKAAASLIITLKTRTTHLNTQITSFAAHLAKAESKRVSAPDTDQSNIATKVKVLKKIISTTEKHSNDLLMMELALRDVIEQGGQDLQETLGKTEQELRELIKVYEKRMRKYMGKLSPEAVEKSMGEELRVGL
jgi:hypothetical protein